VSTLCSSVQALPPKKPILTHSCMPRGLLLSCPSLITVLLGLFPECMREVAKLSENLDFLGLMLFMARRVRFFVLRETHDNDKNNNAPPSHCFTAHNLDDCDADSEG